MPRITVLDLQKFKTQRHRFSMLTAYDHWTARLLEQAGIEVLLVGDSLGMVMHGHESTLPVTMDMMVAHAQAVARGTEHALVVADMPFLSYQVSVEDALRNGGRLLQQGGAGAVKLEGGRAVAPQIAALTAAGIPVMGHLGLTPQSVHQLGGYRVQGKTATDARRILDEARTLQDAGVFALVLECVPRAVAERITAALSIPTIGIGAGPHCDGQVLVTHDMLGLVGGPRPRHVKIYAPLGDAVTEAVRRYREEVAAGVFPGEAESFGSSPEVAAAL
ncbi:MAG TPA: 3-methyl-2-oxobutanoate hydroxymethyltransferase [Candidatus Xenobia bacterium]|jgi:3-methyl-2-oxobutanoate hydroxymethyltransferase